MFCELNQCGLSHQVAISTELVPTGSVHVLHTNWFMIIPVQSECRIQELQIYSGDVCYFPPLRFELMGLITLWRGVQSVHEAAKSCCLLWKLA